MYNILNSNKTVGTFKITITEWKRSFHNHALSRYLALITFVLFRNNSDLLIYFIIFAT